MNKWVSEGWGGYSFPALATSALNIIVMLTPKLTLEEAQAGMKPLTDIAIGKSLTSMITSLPLATDVLIISGFYSFTGSGGALQDANGAGAALSSCLVVLCRVSTSSQRTKLLLQILYTTFSSMLGLSTLILSSSCSSVSQVIRLILCQRVTTPGGPGASSVTPAWRTSPWHVIYTWLVLSFNIKEPVGRSDRL